MELCFQRLVTHFKCNLYPWHAKSDKSCLSSTTLYGFTQKQNKFHFSVRYKLTLLVPVLFSQIKTFFSRSVSQSARFCLDNWTVRPLKRSVVGVRWLKITHAHTFVWAYIHTHAAKQLMRAAETLSHRGRAKVRKMCLLLRSHAPEDCTDTLLSPLSFYQTHIPTNTHTRCKGVTVKCNGGHCSHWYGLSCCVMTAPN